MQTQLLSAWNLLAAQVYALFGWFRNSTESLFALLWTVIVIYVLYRVWTHPHKTTSGKVLWTILIVLLPVLGVILWLLFGQLRDNRFA